MGDNWKSLAKSWSKNFCVHLIDQRNHGRSFWSPSFDYNVMAQDLLYWMDKQQIGQLSLLGHSMGGKTAMRFASENPDRIDRLIIADISPRAYPPHHELILSSLAALDFNKIKELTNAHLDKLKINVKSADQKVEELSGGQRQAVAIARSTAFNAKVVIMDEPTAALAIKEVGKVLDLINSLKKTGVGVIVISHRMDDIFAVCDRVMALFQGTNFAESELSKTSRDEVIGWIMGKK